jgi:hypothetical protein
VNCKDALKHIDFLQMLALQFIQNIKLDLKKEEEEEERRRR